MFPLLILLIQAPVHEGTNSDHPPAAILYRVGLPAYARLLATILRSSPAQQNLSGTETPGRPHSRVAGPVQCAALWGNGSTWVAVVLGAGAISWWIRAVANAAPV